MSNSPFDPNSPPFTWYQPPGTPNPARPSLADLLAKIQPEPPAPSWADLLVKSQPKPPALGDLLAKLHLPPLRPRIFVSYQHSSDQYYYNEFSRVFHDSYETVYDASLDRRIDSDASDYVMQRIRDDYLTGTS